MRTSSRRILRTVCELTGIPKGALLSSTRKQEYADARFLGYYALHKRGYGASEASRVFNRDRGSIYNGIKKAEALIDTDPKFKKLYQILDNRIERHEITLDKTEAKLLRELLDECKELAESNGSVEAKLNVIKKTKQVQKYIEEELD